MNDRDREEIGEQMQAVLDWCRKKRGEGQEPPWIWYQLYKLDEAIVALQHPTQMAIPLEDSQESEAHQERADLLPAGIYRIESARRHPSNQPEQKPK